MLLIKKHTELDGMCKIASQNRHLLLFIKTHALKSLVPIILSSSSFLSFKANLYKQHSSRLRAQICQENLCKDWNNRNPSLIQRDLYRRVSQKIVLQVMGTPVQHQNVYCCIQNLRPPEVFLGKGDFCSLPTSHPFSPKITYLQLALLMLQPTIYIVLKLSTNWCWPITSSSTSLDVADVPYNMFQSPSTGAQCQC